VLPSLDEPMPRGRGRHRRDRARGRRFVLSGTKLLVRTAFESALVVAVAPGDSSTMGRRARLFLVPKDAAGIEGSRVVARPIDEPANCAEVRLDDCRGIGRSASSVEGHGGWPVWSDVSTAATVALADEMCGGPSRCRADHSYAKLRIAFASRSAAFRGSSTRRRNAGGDRESRCSRFDIYAAGRFDEGWQEAPLAV